MKLHKKVAVIALAFTLALVCAACGGAQSPGNSDYKAEGSVVFDKDGVKVTTAGFDTDPTSLDADPIIWLEIENAGSQEAHLGVTESSVDGVMNDMRLIEFYTEEDGTYYGGNYDTQLTIPAESSGKYALWFQNPGVPGVTLDAMGEAELRFTTAKEEYGVPDYVSEPVTIKIGEAAEPVDIAALGSVVLDDEKLTLVIGEQDYDDWFGPSVYVYAENKTDRYIGIAADTADADGNLCDYIYYSAYVAPRKIAAGNMSFEGAVREMKGFENLTVQFKFDEAETRDKLDSMRAIDLEAVTVQYPPQVWGEYENGGLSFEIQPKYNDLLTVETPVNDPEGVLFKVSETASLEAGGHDGAGWLFSIGAVSEEKLHDMLCWDMSGAYAFATDANGAYYILYHPTDVRYERATTEEMQRDIDQWTMLNEWTERALDGFIGQNNLENVAYGNSPVDMYIARAAYLDGANFTIESAEYGAVKPEGVDAAPYAEFILNGHFTETDMEEKPDGDFIALNFPDDNMRLEFFFAPEGYVRVVSGDNETLYQAFWTDDDVSYAEAVRGWYYAAAELSGLKSPDEGLSDYYGVWYEKIAGRGEVSMESSLAPGKVKIQASWPNSAIETVSWNMTAALDDEGRLVYENGKREVRVFDGEGNDYTEDEGSDESGAFYLDSAGELRWHDERSETDDDSAFIRAD